MARGLFITVCVIAGCMRVGFDEPSDGGGGDSDRPGADWSALPADPPLNDPAAVVQVSDLRSIWATTEWVFWFWATTGVAGDLDTFEVTVAESMVEAVNGVGSATTTVFEGAAMPPSYNLRQLGGLLFGDRTPDTEYVALLIATDNAGRQSVAVAVPTRTLPEPTEEVVIFRDADTAGYSIPDDFTRSNAAPFAGTHHYSWTVNCTSPPCYDILRRQELGIDLTAIDASNFDRAFVEFAAASNSAPASSQSMVRMWFGTSAAHDGTTLFGFGGWTMRADNAYRVYQFPLSALGLESDMDTKLTVDIASRGLFEFGVSGEWSAGSVTRLDEWRIRW